MAALKKKNKGPPVLVRDVKFSEPKELKNARLRDIGLICIVKNPTGLSQSLPKPPKELRIHNSGAVRSWLVLYIPNVTPDQLPALNETFARGITTTSNDRVSPLYEIGRFRKSKENVKEANDKKATNEFKHSLESIKASKEVLSASGYPNSGLKLDLHEGSGQGFAIDCEMCLSGTTSVLTRIAVVKFPNSETLLDRLVKPDVEITDYLTPYSGITAEMLKDVTFSLDDAQSWLRNNIGKTDFLIGHSLDNDLNVLKIQHDYIVDTSLLYPHYKGPPYRSSLKYLAKVFLDWEIQKSLESGHNPVEDAVACEKLVRLILQNGLEFGNERLHSTALTSFLAEAKLKSTIIGPGVPAWDANGSADHISETDISKCVDLTLKACRASNNNFVCCTLEAASADLALVNEQIKHLMQQLPSRTLVTAITTPDKEHSLEVDRLRLKKRDFQLQYRLKKWDEIVDPWTSADDNALYAAVGRARRGYSYITVTFDPEALKDLPQNVRERVILPPANLSDETEDPIDETAVSTRQADDEEGTENGESHPHKSQEPQQEPPQESSQESPQEPPTKARKTDITACP